VFFGSIVPVTPEPLVGREAPNIVQLRPLGHWRPFITAGHLHLSPNHNMKTQKSFSLVLIFLATTATLIACKKTSSTKKNCKIVDASIVGSGDIHITYNAQGRIAQVSVGVGSMYTFTYLGDTVLMLNTDSGIFQSRTVYTNNAAGLMTYQRTIYDQAGTNWSIVSYEYNGEELSKSTTTTSSGAPPVVNTYGWFNHNMVAQASGTSTTIYDYYTDKPEQSGDYFAFFQILQGGLTIRNQNLVKSTTGIQFNYSFDADGKISSLELEGNASAAILNYSYQCN
jgi:hypothetical protein